MYPTHIQGVISPFKLKWFFLFHRLSGSLLWGVYSAWLYCNDDEKSDSITKVISYADIMTKWEKKNSVEQSGKFRKLYNFTIMYSLKPGKEDSIHVLTSQKWYILCILRTPFFSLLLRMQILTIEHLKEENVSHFHFMRWFKQLIYYEYKPFHL